MKSELKKAVVFAILMQTDDGILSKSPEYILEKWKTAHALDDPSQVLDHMNRSLLEKWKTRWPSSERG